MLARFNTSSLKEPINTYYTNINIKYGTEIVGNVVNMTISNDNIILYGIFTDGHFHEFYKANKNKLKISMKTELVIDVTDIKELYICLK